MQPIKILSKWLMQHASSERYLFATQDFRSLFPSLSDQAFKTLLSRAVDSDLLIKVCRGIYLYKTTAPGGLILFHTAALLRANDFNYISLETALSDSGIISQIPINRVTIMSSGRSNIINCGQFGTIEFIHTAQQPEYLADQLHYDNQCRLWRASTELALRDMRATRRSQELINKGSINESI
jgi:hypothetical protein